MRSPALLLTLVILAVACDGGPAEPACTPDPRMPLEGRASPYDSATIALNGEVAKICYGRPSSRERTMIGGEHVPYGRLWRTGANEPTVLHVTTPVSLAGIQLDPGSYSLYTVPGPERWEIIANASTDQWGIESRYTGDVRAEEVGRALVAADTTESHVETFTIRGEDDPDGVGPRIVIEWERTRLRIPLQPLE